MIASLMSPVVIGSKWVFDTYRLSSNLRETTIQEGFKAGCRAAKNDMGDGTMSDEAFGCGCAWAAMVFVLLMLGLSFEQSFFTGLGCGLAIMYIIYDYKRCK